eukprot:scaffold272240_cov30-Tisochrysis_lutea.AAC.2
MEEDMHTTSEPNAGGITGAQDEAAERSSSPREAEPPAGACSEEPSHSPADAGEEAEEESVQALLARADAALADAAANLLGTEADETGVAPATARLHWLLQRMEACPFEGQPFSPAHIAEAAVGAVGSDVLPRVDAEANAIADEATSATEAEQIVSCLERQAKAAAAALAEREEDLTPARLASAAMGCLRPAAAQHVFDACSATEVRPAQCACSAVPSGLSSGTVWAALVLIFSVAARSHCAPLPSIRLVQAASAALDKKLATEPRRSLVEQVEAAAHSAAELAQAVAHGAAGQAQAVAHAAVEQAHVATEQAHVVAGAAARRAAAALGIQEDARSHEAWVVGAAALAVAAFAVAAAFRARR